MTVPSRLSFRQSVSCQKFLVCLNRGWIYLVGMYRNDSYEDAEKNVARQSTSRRRDGTASLIWLGAQGGGIEYGSIAHSSRNKQEPLT
jgi:hypothetical protein